MVGLNARQALGDEAVDGDVARALGARDPEGDDRLVEQPREGARLRGAVGDRSPVRRAAPCVRLAARSAVRRDRRRARAGERADRLFLAGDLAASAAEVDIVGAHLRVDRRGGDAEREQLLGVERDADLAVDAAEALVTSPTPLTLCSSRATVSSMNQDNCSTVMPGAEAA